VDSRKFDALTRSLGNPTTRRHTLQGLAVGLLGLGVSRNAAAQSDAAVGAEGCRVRRCKKGGLRDRCLDRNGRPDNHACCQGLKCSNKNGKCTFKNAHGGAGDYCDGDNDCNVGFFCKKNQCIPNSC
jgi:hypothetical protein